jgi:DNA (cytosine-5)-methyltransferase 1
MSGYRVLGAVENHRAAAETYRANHGGTVLWEEDIRTLAPKRVKKELSIRKGQLDLLAGCPPCQGFSTMRTLNGSREVDDERNDLIFDFLRFAEELYPKSLIMENVPALLGDRRTHEVCDRLDRLGYSCITAVLDAADYGVPQRRKRMLLLASRTGPVAFPPTVPDRSTVRHAIEALAEPGSSGDSVHDLPAKRAPHVLKLIRAIPKDGGSRSDLGPERQLPCHRKCDGFKDVYGRMRWDDVSPTITSGCVNPSKGRFLHPEQDRAITLREAALLQGFSPDYVFPVALGRYPLATLIGNAVPAPLVVRQVSVFAENGRSRRKGGRPEHSRMQATDGVI